MCQERIGVAAPGSSRNCRKLFRCGKRVSAKREQGGLFFSCEEAATASSPSSIKSRPFRPLLGSGVGVMFAAKDRERERSCCQGPH